MDPDMMDLIWIPKWIRIRILIMIQYASYIDPLWIPMWIRYGSQHKSYMESYMDPYVDPI